MVQVVAWLRPWVEELGIKVWDTIHLMRRSERAVREWRKEIQTEW